MYESPHPPPLLPYESTVMTQELEYKGHKAKLEVTQDQTFFTTFPDDSLPEYTIEFKSPMLQAKSKPCTASEKSVISNMYIKWWQQAVRKVINSKP